MTEKYTFMLFIVPYFSLMFFFSFQEVNSQLNEAALSEQHARKQLQEANTKVRVFKSFNFLYNDFNIPPTILNYQYEMALQKRDNLAFLFDILTKHLTC